MTRPYVCLDSLIHRGIFRRRMICDVRRTRHPRVRGAGHISSTMFQSPRWHPDPFMIFAKPHQTNTIRSVPPDDRLARRACILLTTSAAPHRHLEPFLPGVCWKRYLAIMYAACVTPFADQEGFDFQSTSHQRIPRP